MVHSKELKSLLIPRALSENVYHVIGFCCVAAVLVILNIIKPLIFSRIIDMGLVVQDWSFIKEQCLYFAGIAVLIATASFCQGVLASVISNRVGVIAKKAVTEKLYKLGYVFYQKFGTGDVLARVDGDTDQIRNFLMTILYYSMTSLLGFIAAVVFVGYVEWRMLVASFVIVPFVGLRMYAFRNVTLNSNLKVSEDRATSIEQMTSGIQNIIHLRQINLDAWSLDKIKKGFQALKRSSIIRDSWMQGGDAVTMLLMAIGYTITIGYGGLLVVEGSLSVGYLFAFLTLRDRFNAPVYFITQSYQSYLAAKASLQRISVFYENEEEDGISQSSKMNGSLKFDHVEYRNCVFRYNGQNPCLEVNTIFNTGWNTIYGNNGTGKTTVLRLLLKLIKPAEGKILIDDTDIARFNNQEWRHCISAMPSDTYLFSGTIRENIRLFDDTISDHEIVHILTDLGIEEDTLEGNAGVDFVVSDGGRNVSDGQRQKIALARVLVRNSPIVVLDEPFSHFDGPSKQSIQCYLKRRLTDKIVICVSHDDVTDITDHAFVIKNGNLVNIS